MAFEIVRNCVRRVKLIHSTKLLEARSVPGLCCRMNFDKVSEKGQQHRGSGAITYVGDIVKSVFERQD